MVHHGREGVMGDDDGDSNASTVRKQSDDSHGREGMMGDDGDDDDDGDSHGIHRQEAESDESWCSACFLLFMHSGTLVHRATLPQLG